MYFDSFSELLFMGGHGPYVWSVYGVAAVILGSLILAPILKRRRFFREENQRLRREERQPT
jgi:heme exporter protein D